MMTVRAVLERYARTYKSGHPVRCRPSQKERAAGKVRPDGKVIFDSREQATSAAVELERITGEPKRAYPCNRSKTQHFHLTRDRRQPAHRQQTH